VCVNTMPKRISSDLREAHQSGKDYLQTIWSPSCYSEEDYSRGIHSSGKYSRQLPVFPGVDVPANSPKGQTVQWSEKKSKTKELHF